MLKSLLFLSFFISFVGCHSTPKAPQYDYKWVILPQYKLGFHFLHGVAFAEQGAKFGLIDTTGKWLMPPQFNNVSFFHQGEGLAVVEQKNLMGFIDTLGKWVIPAQFRSANPFREGFAGVQLGTGKWTFVKHSNLETWSKTFDRVSDFSGGLAAVEQTGKWGLIDTAGQFVLTPQFERLVPFKDGLIGAKSQGKYGFIDKTGKIIVPFQYDDESLLFFGFGSGYTLLKQAGKNRVLNSRNQIITAPEYDVIAAYTQKGVFAAKKNKQCGLLDTAGKEICPFDYDEMYASGDDLIRVTRQEKYGFINMKGQVIIPLIYDHAWDSQEGFIAVRTGKLYGLIDIQGNVVIPPTFALAEKVSEGLMCVKQGEQFGYVRLIKK